MIYYDVVDNKIIKNNRMKYIDEREYYEYREAYKEELEKGYGDIVYNYDIDTDKGVLEYKDFIKYIHIGPKKQVYIMDTKVDEADIEILAREAARYKDFLLDRGVLYYLNGKIVEVELNENQYFDWNTLTVITKEIDTAREYYNKHFTFNVKERMLDLGIPFEVYGKRFYSGRLNLAELLIALQSGNTKLLKLNARTLSGDLVTLTQSLGLTNKLLNTILIKYVEWKSELDSAVRQFQLELELYVNNKNFEKTKEYIDSYVEYINKIIFDKED